jgi:hypothetical protein
MSEGPYLRAYLWLLLTVCCTFTIAACNNSSSSDTAEKKVDAPASSAAPTSAQSPPLPAATTTQSSNAPKIDPNAPIPALSTDMIEAFSKELPELAAHREAILKAELEAMQGAVEGVPSKLGTPVDPKKKVSSLTPSEGLSPIRLARSVGPYNSSFSLIPSAHAAEFSMSTLGSLQGAIIGMIVGLMIGPIATEIDGRAGSEGGTKTTPIENGGEVKAEFTVSAQPGSATTVELTTKIQIPIFFMDANSKLSVKGSFCPSEDGNVSLTATYSSQGKAGKGKQVSYAKKIAATVHATVGEDANAINENIQTSQSDQDAASLESSRYMGTAILQYAKDYWQGGKCIAIEAKSPGNVKHKATSVIPVAVRHKVDGSSVPAKVTVELTGGESVSPSVIPRAPGDVTHVAVDEDRLMTVALTALSRRGKAVAKLDITTGRLRYDIKGGADDIEFLGVVCNFSEPFEVSTYRQAPTIDLKERFTPTSKAGGTYKYSGKIRGFEAWGNGTYTIIYDGDVPMRITAKGPGTVKTPMGDMTAEGTEEYKVTPPGYPCTSGEKNPMQ